MISPQSFYTYLAIISLLFHIFNFSSIEAQNDNIPNIVQASVNAYKGQYLMELYIGTPPIKISGIADTGSDLIWVQCVPCFGCYKQINPMFDPTRISHVVHLCVTNLKHVGVLMRNIVITLMAMEIVPQHMVFLHKKQLS
jgi:hypothetical protein